MLYKLQHLVVLAYSAPAAMAAQPRLLQTPQLGPQAAQPPVAVAAAPR
jgi:hypothetical protein